MSKCIFCEYKNIDKNICFDIEVDRCIKCDYIRILTDDFEKMVKSYAYINNFFGIKKCDELEELDTVNKKKMNKFLKYLDLDNMVFIGEMKEKCNICNETTTLHYIRRFKKLNIYYCDYCKSIYFKKENFIETVEYIKNRVEKESKWYGFVYKFLEIFH